MFETFVRRHQFSPSRQGFSLLSKLDKLGDENIRHFAIFLLE